MVLFPDFGPCRAGMAWKTAKSWNGDKMENQMQKRVQLDRGEKWPKNGFLRECPVFLIFRPCPDGGRFLLGFPFFWVLTVFHAIPARHDPKSGKSKALVFLSFNVHAPCIRPPTIWAISIVRIDSRESGDSHESEIRVIRANRSDAL